ncbi:tRNA (adenosine(37)-N6)-dimethylallyltransferase MiaA [Hippea maritima]|uniref:tRNA dimethylallyltransferase n=1 Tax=Hippea maritima (strain ATCC 700847 / DSM 10411 / MH2) TaxID=760142 RepID=F2LY49_HIPMA|nr:tRNA (adenosine(37)-N6)-dimethylallyltransferase MiaA [Hippea maritima]AEA34372.1 tRNA dimethylallyltransferase [Hippea maritima DSM 10411]
MKPIIIAGQTATGKTDAAIAVAKEINGEIISADAVQIYRFMDIGSAKPSREELRKIKHYFIDIKNPDENFSAGEFAEEARKIMDSLKKKGKNSVIVGGTAFYLEALVFGIDQIDAPDKKIKRFFDDVCDELGSFYLYEWLKLVDEKWSSKVNPNDCQRIKRGLSVYVDKLRPISSYFSKTSNVDDFCIFVLHAPREFLKKRIALRVDKMIESGLIEEVKRLLAMGYGSAVGLKAIGYKETVDFIRGRIATIDELKERITFNTLSFAKRQLTFLRSRFKDAVWIDIEKEDAAKVILNSSCCHLP